MAGAEFEKLHLYSMPELERLLGAPRSEIFEVASLAGQFYRPFEQRKKPRPFQKAPLSSKLRPIDNPIGKLKIFQRRINRRILRRVVYPTYLCAGVNGRSLLDNARIHLSSPVLATLDIRSFFPSISNIQVNRVWREILDCSLRIASVLTKLTTFERHLPQGAPTSTLLANLVLFSVDGIIRDECSLRGVRYSTWVDDLAFSGQHARGVIGVAVKALSDAGFSVSHNKLKIMGPGDRKVLTGIMLGKQPAVLPQRLSNLRSGIHKLRTGQVPLGTQEHYVRSLRGGINFVGLVSQDKARRLHEDLDNCLIALAANGEIA
jgi:RNA-directed DNA polymerase